jgi:hypothetical protein
MKQACTSARSKNAIGAAGMATQALQIHWQIPQPSGLDSLGVNTQNYHNQRFGSMVFSDFEAEETMQGVPIGLALFVGGVVALMLVKPRRGVPSRLVDSDASAVAISLLLTTMISGGLGLIAVRLL